MNSTIRRFAAVVAVPAALTLALTACGGAERPTADDISKSLTDGKAADAIGLPSSVPDEAIDCMADLFEKSDLSDEALNALVEGDKDFEGSEDDEKALEGLQSDLTSKCADAMTGQ